MSSLSYMIAYCLCRFINMDTVVSDVFSNLDDIIFNIANNIIFLYISFLQYRLNTFISIFYLIGHIIDDSALWTSFRILCRKDDIHSD